MNAMKMLFALALSTTLLSHTNAEEVHVAVAANFTAAMKEIAAEFEKDFDHKVTLSFSSSGKIYAQIKHGAPYQVFLSADQAKPLALANGGLIVPGSRFTYAIGSLALWSAKTDYIDDNFTPLKKGNFNKVALANPRLAPYGLAATEVLEALNLTEATKSKWVQGENIAQTYQFVATGNADLGFVALSQIMDKGHVTEGSSWIIPAELYNPIRQDAVLLKSASDNKAAIDLIEYLKGDKTKTIIKKYGYISE